MKKIWRRNRRDMEEKYMRYEEDMDEILRRYGGEIYAI